MAKREEWTNQTRSGRGGGIEYYIGSLPAETQRALRISYAKKKVSFSDGAMTAEELKAAEAEAEKNRVQRLDQGIRDYMKLRGMSRIRCDAKTEIVLAAQDFIRDSGLSGRKGVEAFVTEYNSGGIRLTDWIHREKKKVSISSVYDWINKYKNKGVASLAGNYGSHRKGTGLIDTQPELKEYILGMLVNHPDVKYSVLLKALKAKFESTPIEVPSSSTLERWVNKWKKDNQQVYTAVTNPDAWKNKYMAAPGDASERATGINQLWEFDATPADMMLTDGRHSLSGVIDVATRRLKLIVTRTANSKSVAQVIRAAILDWGVPEIAKTDNGADYTSKHIRMAFERLGIEQELCPPFQGWKKPHIERAFRTFAHDIAELLPGFIGHNVSERQAIEARKSFSDRLFQKDTLIEVKMTSDELQEFCDKWIDTVYHRDTHSGLGKSPLQAVRDCTLPVRHVDDERVLDILLSEPAGTRTITKKGIKLDRGLYIHPELWARAGDEVQIYYDDRDIGSIYVYDLSGEFVCIAEDPDITGVSRTEVAAKAKEIQKEVVQEERRRLKAASRRVVKHDVAQKILEHRAIEASKDKTIDFPKRTEIHSSDGIEAAKDTLWAEAGFDRPETVSDDPEQPSTEQQLAEILTLNQQPKMEEETDQERYQRWLHLDKRVKSGDELEGREALFYDTFQQTPEFKTYSDLAAMGMLKFQA
jgi:transposase InsO family protein